MKDYSYLKKYDNYKEKNKQRYIKYKKIHNNLSIEQIITYVNIGLDNSFYTNIKNAQTELGNKILVNKYLKLNKNYIPNDLERINNKYFIDGNTNVRLLRKEAKNAFEKLSEDSINNKTPVYGQSAYRSYLRQKEIYQRSIKEYGFNNTEKDTARPGHSEHQTGLTIDVSSNKQGNMLNFENTLSFKWIKNNAYKYGFILRYPKGKEKIHGFIYESWHYRYVGKKIAKDMYKNHPELTYDEYYYKYIENKKNTF